MNFIDNESANALNTGLMIRRKSWDEGVVVYKQNEAELKPSIIPNMTSLPQQVKDYLLGLGVSLKFRNQYILLKPCGTATYYNFLLEDLLASDWEIFKV